MSEATVVKQVRGGSMCTHNSLGMLLASGSVVVNAE